MGRINKLDISVANLIAAGEVVDRPCSALKEMLENAVDSGATVITAEVMRGGMRSIRVTDNGCGISKEDLPTALLRHATSKIATAEDLVAIGTLGFRGEALAAISAVSDVRILSRQTDSEDGALLEASAGCVPTVSDVGCAVGTTVMADNLFANVPARQKFLKTDRTETLACTQVAEKIALSHPEIAFRFLTDGAERFATAGDGVLRNVLYAIYGREFSGNLIEVDANADGIEITGYVGSATNNRSNRGFENFFINGRFVRSRTAQAALEEGFCSYMPEGKFPVCALWIRIPLGSVDVNVHPAKLEVKFSNEKLIFDAVYYAVRTAIKNDTQKAEMKLNDEHHSPFRFSGANSPIPAGRPATPAVQQTLDTVLSERPKEEPRPSVPFPPAVKRIDAPVASMTQKIGSQSAQGSGALRSSAPNDFYSSYAKYATPIIRSEIPSTPNVEEPPLPEPPPEIRENDSAPSASDASHVGNPVVPIRYIGIVFDTYIIAERENELLLIDKHAAHERIIYEEMMRTLRADSIAPSMLLIPCDIPLSALEMSCLDDYAEDIRSAGFDFTVEPNGIAVNQIPGCLTVDQATDLLVSLFGSLAAGEGKNATQARDELYSRALYTASCKAAMKGGICDGEEHLKWICAELSRCADIRVCPHGRPLVTVMSKNYLDRSFGRLM